ncbi:MAG TPA: xanthine dehydrogenase family protein molybdopterin-binding subunit [Thermomicrobiales bacterium]|nr:xanthine dehydrogenase family protein molybdopterin-binding subunit [Thermomicrobiales bacterium]
MIDSTMTGHRLLGRSSKRIDGERKITGAEKYTADLRLRGMLFARPVTSPLPHARVRSIDKDAALAIPGVVAVLTAEDLPIRRPLSSLPGKSPLAFGEIAFAGQFVAIVLAESDQAARDAVELVEVDYEELAAVPDFETGVDESSPLARVDATDSNSDEAAAHNADAATQTAEAERPSSANVSSTLKFERGDVNAGFAQAVKTAEVTIRSESVHQGYIEPQVAMASIDPIGEITIYTSTQGAFLARQRAADWLGRPVGEINVKTMAVGGGFGGKFILLEPLTAALAVAVNRPVLLEFGRTDDLAASNPAPACEITVKVGADADGRLTALQGDLTFDTGSQAGSPLQIAAILLGGYYKVENLQITGREVVTNRAPAGAYRAPGAQQATYAIESAIDDLAEALGDDPLEFRLRNCVEEGDVRPNGGAWPRIGLRATLEALRDHPAWKDRQAGTGIAIGGWPGGVEPATSICRLDHDGKFTVVVGSADISGVNTGFQKIAAEVLGLNEEDVVVTGADTSAAPYAGASGGSKVTYTVGAAVMKAAQEARAQVLQIAAQHLEASADDLEIVDGKVQVRGVPSAGVSLKEIASMSMSFAGKYEPVYGRGQTAITESAPGFAAHLANVTVDEETGEVHLNRYVAAQDVGFAINPALVEGQMMGGVAQGIGWALHEAIEFDDSGQLVTGTLMDYVLPRSNDIPPIETILVEVASQHGPFGAKGVGEPPAIPGPATIRNAIKAASGARLSSLPMRPERVLEALQERGQ